MAYYHDLITGKSWQKLQEIRRQFKFILIGGWAVYLYSKALKSKDIDFICDYDELEKLRNQNVLIKNERLKKYEIHVGEFDIDIYTPFFSELGVPVEDIQNMTTMIEGFLVPKIEVLLILKQNAYQNRAGSAKGEKDKIDILGLLSMDIDFKEYEKLLKKYRLEIFKNNLIKILKETRKIPELNMKEHAFSMLKKDVIEKISN